jgi:hypothetical protein
MPRPESVGGVAAPCDAKSSTPEDTTPLWTLKRVAEFLTISERAAWSLANRGAFQTVKIGRARRYVPSSVLSFVREGGSE